ncbi:uncharacterized protein ATC70_001747 [Mucor velutinosus]|uniref:Uncharacterized protein n=1 Tax=Mucor velutinosus TaxID=708070 RepID=A0AAN7HSJ7_9FUNG|nr:hypothetical protein ATC70_001747 [Mucor velutinosus]
MCLIQQNVSAFQLRFLAFKAVLGGQNSTKQLLSSSAYFQSTITEEDEGLFQQFMQQNQDYHITFNPDDNIEDSRLYSRFYIQVNWFGLVSTVAGEDNRETR